MAKDRPATAYWVPGDDIAGDCVDRDDHPEIVGTDLPTAVEQLADWMAKPLEDWQEDGRYLCLRAFESGWRTGLCLIKMDPGGWHTGASLADWETMGGTQELKMRVLAVYDTALATREAEMRGAN